MGSRGWESTWERGNSYTGGMQYSTPVDGNLDWRQRGIAFSLRTEQYPIIIAMHTENMEDGRFYKY